MDRDTGIALMRQQLGMRGTDQNTNIIANLVGAQAQLELGPTFPWFMISDAIPITTVASTRTYAVDADFIKESEQVRVNYLPADGGDPVGLRKDFQAVLQSNYANDTGAPEAYALVGSQLWIYPLPDDAYSITMYQIEPQAALTTNVENGWMKWAPFLIMGKAGRMIATALRDRDALAEFTRWENEGRLVLHALNVQREMEGMGTMQMGGPH